MIEYRLASKKDFKGVQKLENECFLNPYSSEDLKYEFYKNPINKIVVATDEGKIVGFIDYLVTFNSATIMQVAVTEDYRKRGIGTQLLSEMEKFFPQEGEDIVENVTLEVRESNEKAIALYTKNGYQKVLIKKQYYKDGENAIYMLKRLH